MHMYFIFHKVSPKPIKLFRRTCPTRHGQRERQTDRRTDRKKGKMIPVYPKLACGGGGSRGRDRTIVGFKLPVQSAVFSGYSVSSTNRTDRYNITQILLKVALSTIKPNTTSKLGTLYPTE